MSELEAFLEQAPGHDAPALEDQLGFRTQEDRANLQPPGGRRQTDSPPMPGEALA